MICWIKNAALGGRASERSWMVLIGSFKITSKELNKVDAIVVNQLNDSKAGEFNKDEISHLVAIV